MATSADKNSQDDKVFDVSKPGKAAASPNSRPLIVGHKAILKDPMVKDNSVSEMDEDKTIKIEKPFVEDSDVPSGSPALPAEDDMPSLASEAVQKAPSESGMTIEPLSSKSSSTSKKDTANTDDTKVNVRVTKSTDTDDSADKPGVIHITAESSKPTSGKSTKAASKAVETTADTESATDDDSKSDDKTTDNAAESSASDSTEAKKDSADKNEPEDSENKTDAEATDSDEEPKTDSSITDSATDDSATPSSTEAQKKAEKEAQEAIAKKEKIDKLVLNKQYFVPIGEKTRKKRSVRRLLTGFFFILLLGGALAYLMIDVGIIKTSYKLPYHFFKQTAVTDTVAATDTTPKTTTTVTKTVDPYKDWKSYCDTTTKLCFKYPSDWQKTDQSSKETGVAQVLLNKNATVTVDYVNLLPAAAALISTSLSVDTSNPTLDTPVPDAISISNPTTFHVVSISDIAGIKDHKVVGGYYSSGTKNIPIFYVTSTSIINAKALKVGGTSEISDISFVVSNKLQPKNTIIYGGGPISSKPYTATQANDWFKSTDAKTALLALQSFYAQ